MSLPDPQSFSVHHIAKQRRVAVVVVLIAPPGTSLVYKKAVHKKTVHPCVCHALMHRFERMAF
ncbi:hypothetical protein [Stieleria bergensis]|uniref:hypothetical protein n=1 Tax=Stieleria bergensis TaxID=2528025 RepID=UPI003AF34FAD